MKKLLFFSVFTSIFLVNTQAQVSWGAKIGANLSNASTKNFDQSFDSRFGSHLGPIMDISIPLFPLGVQAELLYLYNGTNLDNGTNVSEYMSFHQIQLPVYAKLKIGVETLGFYATLGPYVSYIVAGNHVVGDNSSSLYGDGSTMNRWDYGLGVGAGIRILKFMVGAGFQYGFANLTDEDNLRFNLWNTSLSISYLF